MPRPPGGLGPETVAALQQLLRGLSDDSAGIVIAATDADIAGRRYAARLEAMALEAGVSFDAILPPDGLNDWNDALRALISLALCCDGRR
jgi:DNA primase